MVTLLNSDGRSKPWEALSFLFNSRHTLESDYLENGYDIWNSILSYRVSGVLATIHEHPGE